MLFPFLNQPTLVAIWPETAEVDSFIGAFTGPQTSVVAIPRDEVLYYQSVSAINDILKEQRADFVFELPAIVVVLKDRQGGVVLPIAPLADNDAITTLVVNVLQILEARGDSMKGIENELDRICLDSKARSISRSMAKRIQETLFDTVVSPLTDSVSDTERMHHENRPTRVAAEQTSCNDGHDDQMVFRFEDGRWEVVFHGKAIYPQDLKGLHYLRKLIACPGRCQHVIDMIHEGRGGDDAKTAITGQMLGVGSLNVARLPVGDVTDLAAIRKYKEHVGEMDEEILRAEVRGEALRAAELKERKAELLRYLAMAESQSKKNPEVEKARKSVFRCVEGAIARIETLDPQFGRHLRNSITTGYRCSYEPEEQVDWRT